MGIKLGWGERPQPEVVDLLPSVQAGKQKTEKQGKEHVWPERLTAAGTDYLKSMGVTNPSAEHVKQLLDMLEAVTGEAAGATVFRKPLYDSVRAVNSPLNKQEEIILKHLGGEALE